MIDAQSNYVNVVVIGTQRHGKWQEVTEQSIEEYGISSTAS